MTKPTSQKGASWGPAPTLMMRRSSGSSTGSLTRRMNRGQAPNWLMRRFRTAQWVSATAVAYTSASDDDAADHHVQN